MVRENNLGNSFIPNNVGQIMKFLEVHKIVILKTVTFQEAEKLQVRGLKETTWFDK